MKVKVFQTNHNGKVEFTRAELEKLLNEIYSDGYKEGEYNARTSSWTWATPYINTTPNYCTGTDNTITAGETKASLATTAADTATNVSSKNVAKNPEYTVKINGTDISQIVNEIFGAGTSCPSKTVESAFDKLAKELRFE